MKSLAALVTVPTTAYAILTATSNTICTTKYGTASVKNVPTIFVHNILPSMIVYHSTPTSIKTITPAPTTSWTSATSTSTIVVSTQSTDTATYTSTLTSTEVDFSTTTSTSTAFTTTTSTSSSTTTISTAAGFTPIASQTDYVAKRAEGNARRSKEAELDLARRAAKTQLLFPAVTATSVVSQHASAVTCGVVTTVYTTLAANPTTSTTTLAPRTILSTSTITVSTSSTLTLAPTTTTVTSSTSISTTFISTVSTSTTITQTNTAVVPQSTAYAQCAPNNLISHVHNGSPIGIISYSSAFTLFSQASPDLTGVDCCSLCASLPDCAGFGQHPSGTCYYLLTQGQCDGSKTWGDAYHYYTTTSGTAYVVGNGGCGALAAVGGMVSST